MYLFDTYALIEVFVGNAAYAKFFDATFTVTHLNIAEFYSYLLRNYPKTDAETILDKMGFNVLPLNVEIVKVATEFKLANKEKKLSWADCIGYIAAKKQGLKFLTGDSDFKGMSNVEFVK